MQKSFAVIGCLIAISAALIVRGDEKQDGETIKLLIERLAGGTAKQPDEAAMTKAWIELRNFGLKAFPEAIAHLQDKRPSFTTDSGSVDETWTLGRACFDVLWCNLEPYNKPMYSSSIPGKSVWWRPNYCREFLDTPERGKAWLIAHQGKSLVDLQIEVLEWVTTNRSKRDVEVSVEDRQRLLDKLSALKKTREPLKPAVPWPL